jgi:hypothetical protein
MLISEQLNQTSPQIFPLLEMEFPANRISRYYLVSNGVRSTSGSSSPSSFTKGIYLSSQLQVLCEPLEAREIPAAWHTRHRNSRTIAIGITG